MKPESEDACSGRGGACPEVAGVPCSSHRGSPGRNAVVATVDSHHGLRGRRPEGFQGRSSRLILVSVGELLEVNRVIL